MPAKDQMSPAEKEAVGYLDEWQAKKQELEEQYQKDTSTSRHVNYWRRMDMNDGRLMSQLERPDQDQVPDHRAAQLQGEIQEIEGRRLFDREQAQEETKSLQDVEGDTKREINPDREDFRRIKDRAAPAKEDADQEREEEWERGPR